MSNLAIAEITDNATLAAAWQALSYVSGKESDRDALADGGNYHVALAITGTIDGQPVAERIDGRLTVGHASERKTAGALNAEHIVASLLGRLSQRARACAIREIPSLYELGSGTLRDVSAGDLEDAAALLAECKERTARTASVRGAVRCEYVLTAAEATAAA